MSRRPEPPADFRSPEPRTLEDVRKLRAYLIAYRDWLAEELEELEGTISSGVVSSFNGRTGAVVPTSGDYTPTLVGLGNVTNDAQLKRSAADFTSFTAKATPVAADTLLIEDSAASDAKKKTTFANLKTTLSLDQVTNDAQLKRAGGDFVTFTTKSAPGPSDTLLIEDASASDAKKKITIGSLPSSGAFTGAQRLDTPPLTPGSIDDEFDSTSLNGAWVFRDFTNGANRTPTATSPLTPYTDITGSTANPKYALHTNGRRSHLLMQTSVTGPMSCGFLRPYTWSAGKFLWARCGTVVTSAINVCGIILMGDSGGVPDTNNYVLIAYGAGGGTGLFSRVRIAGVNTDVTQTLTAGTQTWPYLGIENSAGSLGSSARWWTYGFNDDGGQTILSANVAGNFTPAWFGFDFSNVHGTPTIFSADFIRESTGHPLYTKV